MATTVIWPLGLYFGLLVLTAAAMLGLSWVLGERHKERATGQPYECGLAATGSARLRFPADFYLVGMFFVIFDLETLFLVAWAIAIRQAGWAGYVEMLLFVGVLAVGLAYLWRIGALEWASRGQRRRRAPERQG